MTDEEMSGRMSSQNVPHKSQLDSASLLILGMEGLKPGGLIPVSRTAVETASTTEEAIAQQRIGSALTCAVLYPIVVELVLKHIWEQEQEQSVVRNHDVRSLFVQLRQETQHEVRIIYDQCCQEYKNAIEIGQQQHGTEVVKIDMATLEEALRWNEDAVKNLKYEMTPRGKSVPSGIIWNSENIWVVPAHFSNFAVELTRWAIKRNFNNS